MARLNQMFPSKWLTAADLEDGECTFTIRAVTQEEIGQGEEAEIKWVVWLKEVAKGIVLNKTNATSLANCFGDDTDDWIGKQAVFYPTEVSFSGRMVEAIRIKERATKNLLKKPQTSSVTGKQQLLDHPHARPARQTAEPLTQDEVDDDLPF